MNSLSFPLKSARKNAKQVSMREWLWAVVPWARSSVWDRNGPRVKIFKSPVKKPGCNVAMSSSDWLYSLEIFITECKLHLYYTASSLSFPWKSIGKNAKQISMQAWLRVTCEQRFRGPEVVCEIAMVLYTILDARHSGGRVIILVSLWSSDTHVSKLYK